MAKGIIRASGSTKESIGCVERVTLQLLMKVEIYSLLVVEDNCFWASKEGNFFYYCFLFSEICAL